MKNFSNRLKLQYNEVTAFLTALSCLLISLTRPEFREFFVSFFLGDSTDKYSNSFLIIAILAFIGFVMSIYHIFSTRLKNFVDITAMGIFIMLTNGLVGILAGIEILPKQISLLSIFPIWNILTGILLLYQMSTVNFHISDENSHYAEIIICSIALVIIFVYSEINLHLSWVMALSSTLFYSSLINQIISTLLNYFRFISPTQK